MSVSKIDCQGGDSNESKTFPEPTPHGCSIWVTLDDNNKLYELAADLLKKRENTVGREPTADHPFRTSQFRPSWVGDASSQEAGTFSTDVEYGEMDSSGQWNQFKALVCNTYDDVQKGSLGIADNARKVRVELHKRTDELVYEDGNEYSTPGGWETGKHYSGTALKIDASYVFELQETIAHAVELIGATLGQLSRVQSLFQKTVFETIRFTGIEVYHRHHCSTQDSVVQTLRDSAHLLAGNGGSGQETADIERGMYKIYRIDTNNLDSLGFETTFEYQWKGESYEAEVSTHSIKEYCHQHAANLSEDHPLHHPKLEVRAAGGYPAPAFEALQQHLTEILHAHIHWAGIDETELVADNYYKPSTHDTVTTKVPEDYKRRLKEYFQSDGLKKKVIGMLFHRKTMAFHDILYTLIRQSWRTTRMSYDRLKELTGLTKRTIGRYVSKLVEHRIVAREQSGCMFICISEFAKSHIADLLDKMKTESQVQEEIQQRKQEREAARKEGDSNSTDSDKQKTPSEVALEHSRNDSTAWEVPNPESSVEKLNRRYEFGTVSEKDTAVRLSG